VARSGLAPSILDKAEKINNSLLLVQDNFSCDSLDLVCSQPLIIVILQSIMDTDQTAASITSSADRMVGADHAEVRYFTRYVDFVQLRHHCIAATGN